MLNRKTAAEATGPRYLEPLTRVPNLAELQKQCEMADKARQREVLQAWYLSTGAQTDLPPSYAIGVICPREPYDSQPVWSFYEVLPEQLRTHWSYVTADASLIHNMILCALPEQAIAPEMDNSYAYRSSLSRSEAGEAAADIPVAEAVAPPIALAPTLDQLPVDRSYDIGDGGLGLVPPSDISKSPPVAAPAAPTPSAAAPAAAATALQKEFGYLVAPQKIAALESLLYNPVTGLLSAAAFAHHLSSEFTKRRICGGTFTLIVMRLRTASGAKVNLDKAAQRIGVINEIVRPCDMLYQIDDYGFVLILPDIDPQIARQYCNDFLRKVIPTKRSDTQERVFIKVGAATAPIDGMTSAQVFEAAMTRENSLIAAL